MGKAGGGAEEGGGVPVTLRPLAGWLVDAGRDEGWQMMCRSDGDSGEVRLHAGVWTAQITATFSSPQAQPLPAASPHLALPAPAAGCGDSVKLWAPLNSASPPNPPVRTRLPGARCPCDGLTAVCVPGWVGSQAERPQEGGLPGDKALPLCQLITASGSRPRKTQEVWARGDRVGRRGAGQRVLEGKACSSAWKEGSRRARLRAGDVPSRTLSGKCKGPGVAGCLRVQRTMGATVLVGGELGGKCWETG